MQRVETKGDRSVVLLGTNAVVSFSACHLMVLQISGGRVFGHYAN